VGQPDQRDAAEQDEPGEVAQLQQAPPVEAVGHDAGEGPGDQAGDAGERGDETHLHDRACRMQNKERNRDERKGVADGGKCLDAEQNKEIAVSPQ